MKKYFVLLGVFVVCLMVPCVLVIASNTVLGDKVSVEKYFKMDVYDDGKLGDSKISVHLQIYNYDGDNIAVHWEHVYIRPLHDRKKIQLTPENFSTDDGSITNVY